MPKIIASHIGPLPRKSQKIRGLGGYVDAKFYFKGLSLNSRPRGKMETAILRAYDTFSCKHATVFASSKMTVFRPCPHHSDRHSYRI